MEKYQNPILYCGLLLVLLLTGCTTDQIYRPDQLIRIEHPAYIAELIRPETADFPDHNARFVEGGWLLSLIPKKTGKNIFYDHTVIPGHNARGLPLEFKNVVPLGNNRYLRPGVGIVSRKSVDDHFHDQIDERFPWYTNIIKDATGTTVHFYQFAPRFYFYTRDVCFENSSKKIIFSDNFFNLSNSTIKSQIFFHPFFKVSPEGTPWCRLDSKPDFVNSEHPVLPGKGNAFFTQVENPDKKTWFVCGAKKSLIALWVPGAEQIGYWREKRANIQVFAVEPFVEFEALPWKHVCWSWGVEIP